jgi:hypothetical protein
MRSAPPTLDPAPARAGSAPIEEEGAEQGQAWCGGGLEGLSERVGRGRAMTPAGLGYSSYGRGDLFGVRSTECESKRVYCVYVV